MRPSTTLALVVGAALFAVATATAQPPRVDAIWARSTAGAHITLDGILNEPAWALAESVTVGYLVENGIPGSGWKEEGGKLAKDPTRATIRFLVDGNQLYLAFSVPDSSIGGSVDFNRFDGLLMAIKDHTVAARPAPPAEYLYSWWYPIDTTLANTAGTGPCFRGRPPDPRPANLWANDTCSMARNATQIANWNAETVVNGLTNTDGTIDQSYTVEMRFDLTNMGYDVTKPEGDVVEWNVSIYDTDWYWPINLQKFSVNRSWIESPWGNAMWYDEVHIFARPDVTIHSGPAPIRPPDYAIPNHDEAVAPTIDGSLGDAVWATVPGFRIKWNDAAVRNSYGAVGKWRSGQYQPPVNGGTATVLDPLDATVKMFWKGNKLYLGLDVNDQVVQSRPEFDRWDGFIVTITDRVQRYTDHNLLNWRVTGHVGSVGQLLSEDKLPYLRDTLLAVEAGLQLKPNTTVDSIGADVDEGWTAELSFDLTKLGYPDGLGDHVAFLGVDMLDGDSFSDFGIRYGTRTWWYRQYENECCPAWAYLYPTATTDVGSRGLPVQFALLGSEPNPFRTTTRIRYAMPEWGEVTLEVYDVLGRQVVKRMLGLQPPGEHDAVLGREGLSTGVYVYRLRFAEPRTGAVRAKLTGKAMYLR